MKRAMWVKQFGVCLVVLAMLPSLARALPKGNAANFSQVVGGRAFDGAPGNLTRVVLTTDAISFEGFLWDANVACKGVAPLFVQVFVFTPEGEVEASFDATSQNSLLEVKSQFACKRDGVRS